MRLYGRLVRREGSVSASESAGPSASVVGMSTWLETEGVGGAHPLTAFQAARVLARGRTLSSGQRSHTGWVFDLERNLGSVRLYGRSGGYGGGVEAPSPSPGPSASAVLLWA